MEQRPTPSDRKLTPKQKLLPQLDDPQQDKTPHIAINNKKFTLTQGQYITPKQLIDALERSLEHIKQPQNKNTPVAVKNLGPAGDKIKNQETLELLLKVAKQLKNPNKPITSKEFVKNLKKALEQEQKNKKGQKAEQEIEVKPLLSSTTGATQKQTQRLVDGKLSGSIKADLTNTASTNTPPSGTTANALKANLTPTQIEHRLEHNQPLKPKPGATPKPKPGAAASPKPQAAPTATPHWMAEAKMQQEQAKPRAPSPFDLPKPYDTKAFK